MVLVITYIVAYFRCLQCLHCSIVSYAVQALNLAVWFYTNSQHGSRVYPVCNPVRTYVVGITRYFRQYVCIVAYFCQFSGNFPYGSLLLLIGITVASIVGYNHCFGYASLHGSHCSTVFAWFCKSFVSCLLCFYASLLACIACSCLALPCISCCCLHGSHCSIVFAWFARIFVSCLLCFYASLLAFMLALLAHAWLCHA